MSDYAAACLSSKVVQAHNIVSQSIAWCPPIRGWMKLNVDGSSKFDGISGCGGLIRNDIGEMVNDFMKGLGQSIPFMAELWGLYEGIKLLHEKGISKVEINIDSTNVLKAIERQSSNIIESLSLIRQICSLMDNLEEVIVCHTYRETNKCANALGNMGCGTYEEMVIFDVPPSCILNLIEEDARGIPSIRLVRE